MTETYTILWKNREAEARWRCFRRCKAGEFLDPENGVVSVCKSSDECQGWRALVVECDTQSMEPDG